MSEYIRAKELWLEQELAALTQQDRDWTDIGFVDTV